MSAGPRMYHEFAEWFHLLTAPEDYAEEAEFYLKLATAELGRTPETMLELGSGGGNNASHFKAHVKPTLTDLSAEMLAISRTINPELEHIQGDMRSLRLGRQFDFVFVQDAVCYMLTEEDLAGAIQTAYEHCRPGGVALFAPDETRETLRVETDHGGHDGDGRAMRYLEWVTDPDPDDTTYLVDYAFVFHEHGKPPRVEFDRHVNGVFLRATWFRLFQECGFDARIEPFVHSEVPEGGDIFIARRP